MSSFPFSPYEINPAIRLEPKDEDKVKLIRITTDFFGNEREIGKWQGILFSDLTSAGVEFLNGFDKEKQEMAAFFHSLSPEDRNLLMYSPPNQ